jgi:hypothetical protein
MPGATLPNLSIVLPSLGGDIGTWDDEINAALTLVDAHDHTAGKGLRIKSAAISIDADLSFGGFFQSSVGKVSFSTIAAPSSGSKAIFVNSADNELYWRTNAGVNVKLTNGASINTSLVGGIVGDYAAVGAEVAYDDANDRYTFKQQSTKPWARIMCGGIQLAEFNTTESVFTRLICNAALAVSYDLIFATALPGSTSIVQVDSAGNLTYSSTLVNPPSASDYKFTTARVASIPACAAQLTSGMTSTFDGLTSNWTIAAAETLKLAYPLLGLEVGDQITAWNVYAAKTSAATNTISAELYKMTAGGARTKIGATQSNSANNPGNITLGQSGLTQTVGANESYYIVLFKAATLSAGDSAFDADFSRTRP